MLNLHCVIDSNLIDFWFYITLNSQDHIAMGSLWVEEPVHTSWSSFCTVNHRALASNYQLSNMKCLGRDLNQSTSEVEGEHSNSYTT